MMDTDTNYKYKSGIEENFFKFLDLNFSNYTDHQSKKINHNDRKADNHKYEQCDENPADNFNDKLIKQETRMENGHSSRHGRISNHDDLPLFSVLNSDSGGALLDGVTLDSSNNFDGIITFTVSDPLSAVDYPQPSYNYACHNHHQLQITSRKTGRTWTCNDCTPGINFSSRNKLWDHKHSEHIDSVTIRSAPTASGVARHVLAQLHRDLNTKMFECRCGSRFRSTQNANYHRKCYETVRVEGDEDDDGNTDHQGKP